MTVTPPRATTPDRMRMRDAVSSATAALADPALVGTGAHEQVAAGLTRLLREVPTRPEAPEGRAAAAIRTACAHLAAEQLEDAFIALQCARDQLPGT